MDKMRALRSSEVRKETLNRRSRGRDESDIASFGFASEILIPRDDRTVEFIIVPKTKKIRLFWYLTERDISCRRFQIVYP
jgi:hypothetical protein